jgi:OOP family OmpA-OmpF porin
MRARKLHSTLRGIAAAAFALTFSSAPLAQESAAQGDLSLPRFSPAPAGDRMFGVPSPFVAGDLTPHGMLLFDYGRNPLVLRRASANRTEEIGAVVSDQLFLHANVGLALWNRALVNLDIPFALAQGGDDPTAFGDTFTSPGAAVGDLRLGARIRLVGDYHDIFQLAVGGYVWLPTGSSGQYVSDGAVRGMPQLIAGGRAEVLVWSFAFGPELRRSQTIAQVEQGASFQFGGGVGFLLGEERNVQIGPELTTSVVLADANQRTTNAELLIGARYRFMSFMEAGLGVGPGLTTGVGTPTVRFVGMLAYTPEQKLEKPPPPPSDRDKDEIIDAKDACPDVKGVASDDPKKNGCPPPPPPDTDGDGIIDAKDACPAAAGVASDDPKKNGCPPDKDQDDIIDADDACPERKGIASDDPKKNGCPPDKDGDGVFDEDDACLDIAGIKTADPATNGCPGDTDKDTIRDDKDACPYERGKPDADPKKNGCPLSVRVTETEIIILQQVQFDTGRATIKKVSDPLLDEVAGVLSEHPEILAIEVQGHTDNVGSAKFNEKLSGDRATSVMNALIKRGVADERLVAKGYGMAQPIADNKTAAGRAQNRRVQFKIVEKRPRQDQQQQQPQPQPQPQP